MSQNDLQLKLFYSNKCNELYVADSKSFKSKYTLQQFGVVISGSINDRSSSKKNQTTL